MQFHEVTFEGATPVDGYGPGFFRVGGEVIRGPILLTAEKVISWDNEDVTPLAALAGRIDVLFYGTGAEIAHAPTPLREALEAAGIGMEPMATAAACRTYNVLLAEGRRIALAALPV
ncbi:Mth938-like domain-containing protein [Aliiroseovarius crassostreae]|uniref:Mth938-like domain-containing protein n=1 Tax=Aliiroseovarius crassostreae TaxID=154981 RepID=UPI002202E3E4|nr:Mth938-like domain-containing protein [Aliiroseovarius crassostreae]UWQ05477.1 Mth938-like domain-containing protein [Aliiroseovarius crassostreae]